MRCKKHPKYQAIRRPFIDCLDCWKMYAIKMEKIVRDLFEDIGGTND